MAVVPVVATGDVDRMVAGVWGVSEVADDRTSTGVVLDWLLEDAAEACEAVECVAEVD